MSLRTAVAVAGMIACVAVVAGPAWAGAGPIGTYSDSGKETDKWNGKTFNFTFTGTVKIGSRSGGSFRHSFNDGGVSTGTFQFSKPISLTASSQVITGTWKGANQDGKSNGTFSGKLLRSGSQWTVRWSSYSGKMTSGKYKGGTGKGSLAGTK